MSPDLLSMGFWPEPANPTSEAGLAKGRPTQPPELFGVSGGVGLPGTGLWWKGTGNKIRGLSRAVKILLGLLALTCF